MLKEVFSVQSRTQTSHFAMPVECQADSLHQGSPAQSAGNRREALHQSVWLIYASLDNSALRHVSESYGRYAFM